MNIWLYKYSCNSVFLDFYGIDCFLIMVKQRGDQVRMKRGKRLQAMRGEIRGDQENGQEEELALDEFCMDFLPHGIRVS